MVDAAKEQGPSGKGASGEGAHGKGGTDQEILVGRIAQFGGGLSLIVAGAAVVCWLFYVTLRERLGSEDPPPSPLAEVRERVAPQGPRLQRSPVLDMERLRENENTILESYGWGDEEAATGRIPVERAMELMAERGMRAALSEGAPGGGAESEPARSAEPGTGDMGLEDAGILDIGPRARPRDARPREGGGE